jgi:hypothetical protein
MTTWAHTGHDAIPYRWHVPRPLLTYKHPCGKVLHVHTRHHLITLGTVKGLCCWPRSNNGWATSVQPLGSSQAVDILRSGYSWCGSNTTVVCFTVKTNNWNWPLSRNSECSLTARATSPYHRSRLGTKVVSINRINRLGKPLRRPWNIPGLAVIKSHQQFNGGLD